jgi:hypothetical protein
MAAEAFRNLEKAFDPAKVVKRDYWKSKEEFARRQKRAEIFIKMCLETAKRAIDFHVIEGVLCEGAVRYRMALPFFSYPGGASLTIPLIGIDGATLASDGLDGPGAVLLKRDQACVAWVGMKVRFGELEVLQSSRAKIVPKIEIDLSSTRIASIHVNRNALRASPSGRALAKLIAELNERITAFYDEFLERTATSVYAWLNASLLGRVPPPSVDLCWVFPDESGRVDRVGWRPFRLPAAVIPSLSERPSAALVGPVRCGADSLEVMTPLVLYPGADSDAMPFRLTITMQWYPSWLLPDRVVRGPDGGFDVAFVWETAPKRHKPSAHVGNWGSCSFPPEWRGFLGAWLTRWNDEPCYLVNERLLGRARPVGDFPGPIDRQRYYFYFDSYDKNKAAPLGQADPFETRSEALAGQMTAIKWLVELVESGSHLDGFSKYWKDFAAREPDFLPELWRLILAGSHRTADGSFLPLVYHSSNSLFVLNPVDLNKHWTRSPRSRQLKRLLPEPRPQWKLARGGRGFRSLRARIGEAVKHGLLRVGEESVSDR